MPKIKAKMKSISLILDTVMLEKLLDGLLEGKIPKERISKLRKKYAEEKKAIFTQRPSFFTHEEIDEMSRISLSDEESEAINRQRIKWFEKWFGTLV